jgi:hypothetical protein
VECTPSQRVRAARKKRTLQVANAHSRIPFDRATAIISGFSAGAAFWRGRREGEKATMELIGMRLEKTKLDQIVKNRKLVEFAEIRPMSCKSKCVSIKSK